MWNRISRRLVDRNSGEIDLRNGEDLTQHSSEENEGKLSFENDVDINMLSSAGQPYNAKYTHV